MNTIFFFKAGSPELFSEKKKPKRRNKWKWKWEKINET